MRYFLISVFFVLSATVVGQDRWFIEFSGADVINKLEGKDFSTKVKLENTLEKYRNKDVRRGYVLASVDSISLKGDVARVFYFRGPKFNELNIEVASDEAYLIRKVPGLNEKYLSKTPFAPREIASLLAGILNYLQNNGFPFSRVWLEMDELAPQNTVARLRVEKNREVLIAKIHFKGEDQMSEKYIQNFISIAESDLYNEEAMRAISQRVEQIPFVDEIKPHELLFTPEGAELFLYLKSRPVSLINGVVGLQPNPVTGENVITGDLRLKLQNTLKKGEVLDLNWRSLQPQTQDLKLKANYPFLFGSPFGLDARFDLYRRDSTFLTTMVNIGSQYFMRGGNYLKLFFEAENSNLLSGVGNSTGLPNTNFSSISNNKYGVGIYRRNVDYLPNPSRGFEMELDVLVGRRASRRIDADSSDISTTYGLRFNLNWFIPLSRRHVIRLANRTRAYYAPEVFVNELFRFGGLTTQRGFDEEELFASTLTTFSMEYRFLVDKDSHAFLFYDQSIYENNSDGYYKDTPFGVGAGFSFGTNIGVFSISYAVGKQFENPILLRNGKVHFGYVSYF